ncbi:hypothetical protein [Dysgonomonas sp. Marseille-P4677]|uniref:hypothetical protein n=1 Tax=Dysgonomonas sp. Marseille-P4677 TaxID=2364790 RepID=UPI001F3FD0B2|nr:hypothetical protein [Dysgonomonas sp. Marseille-P4677]
MKGIIVRTVLIIVVILVAAFLLKGAIYRMAVKYEDGGGRKSYELKDDKLAAHINQSLPNDESLDTNIDIEAIIDFSLNITADALDFSTEYTDNEPLKAFENGGANCVGYAAFTAATGSYLIKRFGLDKEWEAKPKKGKLYLFGNNMHKNVKDGWFKDHDFVVFRNKSTKEEIYVDPTAFDYFGVKRVDKRQK